LELDGKPGVCKCTGEVGSRLINREVDCSQFLAQVGCTVSDCEVDLGQLLTQVEGHITEKVE
jgi:hypothetical protein